jgi:hypothetical protein
METNLEIFNLAEKVLSLNNFNLKRLCREAEQEYPEMIDFDVRDNSTMREALWLLGYDELKVLLTKI